MRSPCIATKSNACSPQREKAHAHQRSPITAIQKQKHPARLRPSGFQQRAPAPRLGRGPQCGLMHRLLEGAQGLELLPPSFIVSTPPRGVAGLSLPPTPSQAAAAPPCLEGTDKKPVFSMNLRQPQREAGEIPGHGTNQNQDKLYRTLSNMIP